MLPLGGNILELGAQELDAGESPEEILKFIKYFNPVSDRTIEDVKNWPGGMIGKVYEAAGFKYMAIDVYDSYQTIFLDLNSEDIPPEFVGRFDLVTNFGTTEHIANQVQAFKVVHDALKVGGCAFHSVPFTGYFNHGLIKYEPKFFLFLALNNEYEIVYWGLTGQHAFHRIPEVDFIPGSTEWKDVEFPSGIINFLLRKKKESKYKPAMDTDARKIKIKMPKYIRKMLSVRA